MRPIAHRSCNVRIAKTPAAQWFPSMLTIAAIGISGTIRIIVRMHRGVVDPHVSRVGSLRRQHFLKQDAVFLGVLVYSR
jgi:hypothetical protein